MTLSLRTFETNLARSLVKNRFIPKFSTGDNIRVSIKLEERKRIQVHEGICIAKRRTGINSSFTIRKISFGEGVEIIFPLLSPKILIEVSRRGKARRAKLYYLRKLSPSFLRIGK